MDERELARGTSQAAAIHDIRFGYKDIRDLHDEEIEDILDYYHHADLIQLCYDEISRRRRERLEDKRHGTC